MKTKISMNVPEAFEVFDVEITAVAVISDNDFQSLLQNGILPEQYFDPLKYTEAITTTPTSYLIKEYKAMLVMGENSEHGVAVCGGDSVYRSGLFPNARETLDARIHKMADFACALKVVPDYRSHIVPLEMLGDYGDINVTADNGVGEMLLQELFERDEIADIIMQDGNFEIEYASDLRQVPIKSTADSLTIAGLMGSVLEDFHLLHMDEEHELATIVELNPDTLTEQGKLDWADVLNAKVERIYHGFYGIQADVSGCDAERLQDFSFMLAGNCNINDYERWVNSDDEHQTVFENLVEQIDAQDDENPEITME